jgi:hypothetical protein
VGAGSILSLPRWRCWPNMAEERGRKPPVQSNIRFPPVFYFLRLVAGVLEQSAGSPGPDLVRPGGSSSSRGAP